MKNQLRFPAGFLWGASTSAHQVEGNNENDWTIWERKNSHRLARQAPKYFGRHSPVWNEIKDEAASPSNYISGAACDHWNRYSEDYELAEKIGLNAYRLSVDWARIEPREGQFDQQAIEHYRDMIKSLKRRGIEPFVTLWHWPLPIWLMRKGGWSYPEVSHHFIGYTATVVRALGDDVKFWITLNEPNVYTSESYLVGHWPPALKSLRAYWRAVSNLVKSHREAYHIIKSISPTAQVGIANNFIPYFAYKHRRVNKILLRVADWRWNYTFLARIKNHLDFVGVNHYFQYVVDFGFNRPVSRLRSDLGWELYPEAMYHILKALKRYKLPVYITENGVADREDRYRPWFIRETLRSVHRAIERGVDVRGYFHWSLIDNFEWDKGFWPRFGLIAVNYKTQERTLRPSAHAYAEIIKHNGLPDKD